MEAVPASAELWKKAGCQSLHLSATQGSGMGNFSFNTHFENEADYGAISDRLNEDEAWRDWQARVFRDSDLDRSFAWLQSFIKPPGAL